MERALIRALLLAAAFLLAASDTIQEAPKVQLASEHNVDRELVRKCSSFNYEAGALCAERQAFTLYGDARSGCQKYFWCSPDHGACMMACPSGSVFNQACNCCQDAASTAGAFDLSTCSTAQQPADAAADTANARPASSAGEESREAARKLLAADPAGQANTPSSGSSTMASSEDRQQAQARARARQARRRQRREAAARAAGDSSSDATSSQPQPAKRRMARRSSRASVWNSHGKKYRGAWADRDVVKEPAVRVTTPQQPAAAAAAAQPAAGGSERKLLTAEPHARVQVASISSQAASSNTNQPAAGAGVHLSPAGSSPTQRSMKMKRVQRLAAQAAAAAAAAGDPAEAAATGDALEWATHGGPQHKFIRQRLRPMDQKSAAKAIDPEDEEAAPFAHALAGESQDAKAAQSAGGAGGAGMQGPRGGAGGQQRMRMRRNRLARRAAPNAPKAAVPAAPAAAAAAATAPQAAAPGSTAHAQHA